MSTGNTNPFGQIILHHLENSRSQRILWLLEELEIPYTIKRYKRLASNLAPPELKAIHPLGKSPVLQDGDAIIAESGAIVDYLLDNYAGGRFQPSEEFKLSNLYCNFVDTHFAEGTLMPHLVNHLIFTLAPEKVPWIIKWIIKPVMGRMKQLLINPNIENAAGMIEDHLSKSTTGWFASGPEPTSADFMMLYPLEILPRSMEGRIGPKTLAWVEEAHARPAYRRALEKGGKYNYAKF
ncbi:thioredoxin-like protein [Serendipita vermifera]|nr:thioredoxin-like protein [Serendipita vermifera]